MACGAPGIAPLPTTVALAPTATPLVAATTAAPPTANATPVPTELPPTPTARAITFSAPGGVKMIGTIYGVGTTAVILSNMGDNDPSAWEAFAPKLAARGYTVLTYKFRYPTNSSTF